MAAVIIYGSLYPFAFHAGNGAGPFAALLTTWQFRPEHFGNLIGNVFLYMPFGFFGVLSLGERTKKHLRFGLIVTAGLALSLSMESTQFYIAGRVSTCADIYPNVLGTGLGAVAGFIAGQHFRWPPSLMVRARPVPLLLLFAFGAYRLFPYVPSLDLHQYWQALKPVVLHPQFDAYDIARYAVMWLVVAALGQSVVGRARSRKLLAGAIVSVMAAQIVIVNNSVNAAEIVGATLAPLSWLALSRTTERKQAVVISVALTALVIAERLQPFDFQAQPHAFGWIPFQSFMHGSMAINTQSFLEKFFLYGGLIWILTRTKISLAIAGVAVAAGLLATSVIQTHLPGRSAEITDAIMALIIAGLFVLTNGAKVARGKIH